MRYNGTSAARDIYPHEAMSQSLANIHDAFFKQALSDPQLAATFLREHLPPQIAGLLGPESPEPRQEQMMGWFSQPYYDEGLAAGKAEGQAKGKVEGKVEGEAKILTRLLEKRFGFVPDSDRQRILGADISSIEAWVERAFDAPDLRSVFESN